MKLYGIFVRSARFVYKLFKPYKIVGNVPAEPTVFVVHHQNLSGPVHAILTLPVEAHIWALSVFSDQHECYRQYVDYTFTRRFGMPKFLAKPLAFIVSFAVPKIVASCSAIPVNRHSREIVKTFKASLKALVSGENLIIAPDIDYGNGSEAMGEIYTGFLHLEKIYQKETGKHLLFVPIFYNTEKKTLFIADAIKFDDTPYNEQKEIIAQRIKNSINDLSKK